MTAALLGSLLSPASTSLLGLIVGRGIQGIRLPPFRFRSGLCANAPAKVPLGVGIVATIAPVTGGVESCSAESWSIMRPGAPCRGERGVMLIAIR
jgi:hypothetical protein